MQIYSARIASFKGVSLETISYGRILCPRTKSKDVLFGPQTFDENSGKGNPEDYNVNNLLIVAQLTNLFYRKVN